MLCLKNEKEFLISNIVIADTQRVTSQLKSGIVFITSEELNIEELNKRLSNIEFDDLNDKLLSSDKPF
jgi:hypothetical protein